MPSGSKKADYRPDQYERQLEYSRRWKRENRARVKSYNEKYNRLRQGSNGGQAQAR